MKSKEKLTTAQLKSMHDHISGIAFKDNNPKKDLKLFYNLLTPNKVYVRYMSYGLEPDNSISSKITFNCINPDGSVKDCEKQFDNIKQRMEFESQCYEIDLDANANIVFL